MTTNGAYPVHPRDASAQALLDRLSEPRTAEALHRLLDHAELLAFSATALDGLVQRSDVIVENVAATVGEMRGSLAQLPAVDGAAVGQLIGQLPQLVDLTRQISELSARPEFRATLALLSDSKTLTSLNSLLQHAELIAYLVGAVDALLKRSDTMVESVGAMLQELGAATPGAGDSILTLLQTLHERRDYLPRLITAVPQFTEMIEKLAPFIASEEFNALLESGIFHPDTVKLLGRAGDIFVDAYNDDRTAERRLGPIGAVRALGDPDVQRVIAWAVNFSQRFGKSLNSSQA
jgi:uncharacterized protein YjgD (DUF1641 family)